jgi:hypothetical protein
MADFGTTGPQVQDKIGGSFSLGFFRDLLFFVGELDLLESSFEPFTLEEPTDDN